MESIRRAITSKYQVKWIKNLLPVKIQVINYNNIAFSALYLRLANREIPQGFTQAFSLNILKIAEFKCMLTIRSCICQSLRILGEMLLIQY